ncbi:MAG: hypothetical protein ACTSUX_06000 [Promethearchaeota archaeon]
MSVSIVNDEVFKRLKLCDDEEGNELLKNILRVSVLMLLKYVPITAIKDIQITGSIANGEGTVIKTEPKIIASDIDIVVYLSFPYFLIIAMKEIFKKLSEAINSYFSAKGIKTHICFTGTSKVLRCLSFLNKLHIYDYEFITNKSLLNTRRTNINNKIYTPTKKDALQLTFTVIADYVFLDLKASSEIRKVYLLAKRFLTLLYVILIFEGKQRIKYKQRISSVEDMSNRLNLLSAREIYLARKFTNFKLSGDLAYIFDAFKLKDIKQIISLQKKLLADMIVKVLCYQLRKINNNSFDKSYIEDEKLQMSVSAYFNKIRRSIFINFFNICLLTFISLITKRMFVLRIVGPLFITRFSLINIANYLVTLFFLSSIGSIESRRILSAFINKLGIQVGDIKKIWYQANQLKYLP